MYKGCNRKKPKYHICLSFPRKSEFVILVTYKFLDSDFHRNDNFFRACHNYLKKSILNNFQQL